LSTQAWLLSVFSGLLERACMDASIRRTARVRTRGTTSQRCDPPRPFDDRGGMAITPQRYKCRGGTGARERLRVVETEVMRYVFRPPADVAAGLLTLPWQLPLEEWQDERLVEIRHRGTSRHVVRFVTEQGRLYALKEMNEPLARREYRLLRRLSELGIPAVEPLGIVIDRGTR
jgi:hypothetical protein